MHNRWINNDELYHYGVKGMKWGIRRRQKRDERRARKREKKLRNDFNRNWYRSHNKAAANFNETLQKINNSNKYKNEVFDEEFSSKKGQQYVKELDALWRKEYTKALKEDFGADLGKEYIDNAPMMDSYGYFIKKK